MVHNRSGWLVQPERGVLTLDLVCYRAVTDAKAELKDRRVGLDAASQSIDKLMQAAQAYRHNRLSPPTKSADPLRPGLGYIHL